MHLHTKTDTVTHSMTACDIVKCTRYTLVKCTIYGKPNNSVYCKRNIVNYIYDIFVYNKFSYVHFTIHLTLCMVHLTISHMHG